VTDETYDQKAVEDQRAAVGAWRFEHPQERRIRSEMLFMRVPGQGLAWISARNVLEVDGQPIADSHDRLERALTGDAEGLAERVLSVANEGARFNIGRIQRNFNDPILPLLVLDPMYQSKFKFRIDKSEAVDDGASVKISFSESDRPTIIREARGRNIPLTGALWLHPETGVVVRTEVTADQHGISFNIRIDYRHDAKLDMWIPARMEEHYKVARSEQVDCVAVYSNARRFETSGRIVK